MAKNPDNPKKPVKTPKSKAHRPDVQPIGPALAELLNPAINRGEAGLGSGTGLRPPPDNSKDRRSGGEAAVHRARASTRGTSDDVAKRDAGAAHRDAATQRDAITKRDDASFSPPPAREARGGEGSGVGGASANSVPERQREPAEPPPTPDPSPPLRGGRGAEKQARSGSSGVGGASANSVPERQRELA